MKMLYLVIILPLIITLAAETAAGLIAGYRTGRQIRVILLVNILTNVILNLAVFALRLYVYYKTVNILIFVFEVIIVFAEAVLYRRFLDNTRHPLLFSLAANAASFAAGCLVSLII